MIYSKEVENMCVVAKGPNHGPAPIPTVLAGALLSRVLVS